jgi:hypothetical protein
MKLGVLTGGELVDQLSNHHLLKKVFAFCISKELL